MKKIISLLFILTFAFSTACITSCGRNNDEGMLTEMKLGVGVHLESDKSSAEGSKNGSLSAIYTVAATVFDTNDKIIKCKIDVIEASSAYTSEGKAVKAEEFKSKRELGDSYVMSEDESKLKWYEQADAFAKLCEGKTIEDVKALVASGGKGNSDVISAGCTIVVSEFAMAIEKSLADAKKFTAASVSDVAVGMKVTASTADASASASGKAELKGEFSAKAKNGNKTVFENSKNENVSVDFDTSGKVADNK